MRAVPLALLLVAVLLISAWPIQPHVSAQDRGVGLNQPAATTSGRYYALVIGNNNYTALQKLKTAEADAREIEKLLRESYGFQTKLLLNATRSQIEAALYAYRSELTPDANLLIYYAGHGYNDKAAEKAYWLPVDASPDHSNWIIADEITTGIRVIPAKHVLVISDSCYSGTLTRSGIREELARSSNREQFLQRMAAGRSRTLMASGGDEPVVDSGGGGHSVFASALLRGLSEMDKGQFTGAELFNYYVVEAVAGRAEQTPVYDPLRNSGHESGDFIFIKVKMDGKTVEATVKAPTATVDPAQQELAFWTSIQNSANPEDFKDYLARYPNGLYAGIARRRLDALSSKPSDSARAAPSDKSDIALKPNMYVLAVGVSNYADPKLKLMFPAKDAQDFAATWVRQRGALYRDVIVRVLTDDKAAKDDVLDGLDWIKKETTSKDIAVVFFAGHGVNDANGIYYYLPFNADTDRLLRTGVSFSDIRNTVSAIAGKTLFFIDTTHTLRTSAMRPTNLSSVVNELASDENGAIVFAASTGNQFSLEKPEWGNGAFTKVVLDGLNGGADYRKDGRITVNMLDLYISVRVKQLTSGMQTPTTAKPQTVSDFPIALKQSP